MWNWIEHTLKDSEDFNFLFVAGHYMTIDSRGIYDRSDIFFYSYCITHTVNGSYISHEFLCVKCMLRCLVGKLLPLMEKYNVQGRDSRTRMNWIWLALASPIKGYIQGHRHTLEHVQQPKGRNPSDLHFFTIGAGALYCTSCIKKDILGEIDMNIGKFENT